MRFLIASLVMLTGSLAASGNAAAQEYCSDGVLDDLALICGGGDGPDSWAEEIPVNTWESEFPITIYANAAYTDICVPVDMGFGTANGWYTLDNWPEESVRSQERQKEGDVLYPSTLFVELTYDQKTRTITITEQMSWPVVLERVRFSLKPTTCPDGSEAARVTSEPRMQNRRIGVYYVIE